jgi:peptidoglycan/xylan/chitin deacetylase (PgdA/CDA1 family)
MKPIVAPILALILPAALLAQAPGPSGAGAPFVWPDGKRAALSLTFDDARPSQLTAGVPLFEELGVAVTFYLSPANIGDRAATWRQAARAGHELANHSMTHQCSGNFAWSRDRALEDFTLDRMRAEMIDASRAIEAATGIKPTTFAYPCGQTFVGRGDRVSSYVPLVSELFLAGRGWKAESPNDPSFVDLAQVMGYPMDDAEFEELAPTVEDAIARGQWLVLAGHDIGAERGPQVTRVSMLRALLADLRRPERGVWIDTVANVASYVRTHRAMQEPRP